MAPWNIRKAGDLMRAMFKAFSRTFAGVCALALVMAAVPVARILFPNAVQAQDWRTSSRAPVGWAPLPSEHEDAVVQVYAAPAVRWRGKFADHTWIAIKPKGAPTDTRYEVMGFYLRRNSSAIRISEIATPDQRWYGAKPKLLQDLRGPEAERVAAAVPAAVESYPYANTYVVWPGPNSNTFIAHIAREVPHLRLTLPGNAIGKDFTGWRMVTTSPSGTGLQVSLAGALGVMVAAHEGLEINVLGLVIGVNPRTMSLTLPSIGRFPARDDWTNGAHQARAAASEALAADTALP
jgi:hypothetical protein